MQPLHFCIVLSLDLIHHFQVLSLNTTSVLLQCLLVLVDVSSDFCFVFCYLSLHIRLQILLVSFQCLHLTLIRRQLVLVIIQIAQMLVDVLLVSCYFRCKILFYLFPLCLHPQHHLFVVAQLLIVLCLQLTVEHL